jgi:hypothetical protein
VANGNEARRICAGIGGPMQDAYTLSMVAYDTRRGDVNVNGRGWRTAYLDHRVEFHSGALLAINLNLDKGTKRNGMSRCKNLFQKKGGVIDSNEPFPFSFQVQLANGIFGRPNNGITNVKRLEDGLALSSRPSGESSWVPVKTHSAFEWQVACWTCTAPYHR